MNKDEMKGKMDQAKGFVKEKAGEAIDNPNLEAEGKIDRATGKVREGVGNAKRKAGEVVNEALEDEDED